MILTSLAVRQVSSVQKICTNSNTDKAETVLQETPTSAPRHLRPPPLPALPRAATTDHQTAPEGAKHTTMVAAWKVLFRIGRPACFQPKTGRQHSKPEKNAPSVQKAGSPTTLPRNPLTECEDSNSSLRFNNRETPCKEPHSRRKILVEETLKRMRDVL